jgi:hypothetical protein
MGSLSNDTAETLPADLQPGSRNRLLMMFGLLFFLVAATLVVVAQSSLRRADSPIIIQAQP